VTFAAPDPDEVSTITLVLAVVSGVIISVSSTDGGRMKLM
jgi:hypothetical protein